MGEMGWMRVQLESASASVREGEGDAERGHEEGDGGRARRVEAQAGAQLCMWDGGRGTVDSNGESRGAHVQDGTKGMATVRARVRGDTRETVRIR